MYTVFWSFLCFWCKGLFCNWFIPLHLGELTAKFHTGIFATQLQRFLKHCWRYKPGQGTQKHQTAKTGHIDNHTAYPMAPSTSAATWDCTARVPLLWGRGCKRQGMRWPPVSLWLFWLSGNRWRPSCAKWDSLAGHGPFGSKQATLWAISSLENKRVPDCEGKHLVEGKSNRKEASVCRTHSWAECAETPPRERIGKNVQPATWAGHSREQLFVWHQRSWLEAAGPWEWEQENNFSSLSRRCSWTCCRGRYSCKGKEGWQHTCTLVCYNFIIYFLGIGTNTSALEVNSDFPLPTLCKMDSNGYAGKPENTSHVSKPNGSKGNQTNQQITI